MKKIWLVTCIYSVFLILFLNNELVYASMKNIFFHQLLFNTESRIIEYGLKLSFNTDNNKAKGLAILKSLDIYEPDYKIDILQNDTSFCISFQSENRFGQIVSYRNDLNSKISLEIIEKGDKLALEKLEHKLRQKLNFNDQDITIFRYLKARSNIQDINNINEIIIKELTKINAKHMEVISLDNGFSITALTGNYEKIKNGYTYIDFNCAISSYDSGNYLIIGTPIIMKSY
jgi:hypothetical protein